MGSYLSTFFIDVEDIPDTFAGFVQLLFLFVVYGYILFQASNMISNGSELLLLVPKLAGMIGSVVLPFLGSVPDCAIIAFSGLGDIESVQTQISIGIGALAGSTVMLSTIPWALSIICGRVDINEDGKGNYEKPQGAPPTWSKLSNLHPWSMTKTGVEVNKGIAFNAIFLSITIINFLIVQIPSFTSGCGVGTGEGCSSDYMVYCILVACVLCFVLMIAYFWYQFKTSKNNEIQHDMIDEKVRDAIHHHYISISTAFISDIKKNETEDVESQLLDNETELKKKLVPIVKEYFDKYDINKNGTIEPTELALILNDLGEHVDYKDLKNFLAYFDTKKDEVLEFEEFLDMLYVFIYIEANDLTIQQYLMSKLPTPVAPEEMDEENEMPEEFKHLSARQQQYHIIKKSFFMMIVGTLIIILFSDPMVDILDNMGQRLHIPSFYVSFLIAPFISNAGELIAAYNYAKKKTIKTTSISIAALQGSVVVSNNLGLGIFLLIIYLRGLKWVFSAETISIIVIELFIIYLSTKKVQKLYNAYLLIFLFPFSLFIVYGLENWAGLN